MTVPNQNVYTIIAPKAVPPFLQIPIKYFTKASKDLSGAGFKLYIYFASNKSGFNLEMWPVDIEKNMGITRATIYRALEELKSKRYIVDKNFYVCGKDEYDKIGVMENEAAENKVSLADYGIADSQLTEVLLLESMRGRREGRPLPLSKICVFFYKVKNFLCCTMNLRRAVCEKFVNCASSNKNARAQKKRGITPSLQ